jgi:hypothetical protein
MSTIQLSPYRSTFVACFRRVAFIGLIQILLHGTVAMADGSADPSRAASAIADRYDALQKGDIDKFAAVHKDARWIQEGQFRAQHQKFSRYVVRERGTLKGSEKLPGAEVYFVVDEYYKGQSDPTRMHFLLRLERDRWVIAEFNADEPRSPTERSVEEKARRMLNTK